MASLSEMAEVAWKAVWRRWRAEREQRRGSSKKRRTFDGERGQQEDLSGAYSKVTYVIMSTSVRLDQQLLVSTDESAKEALDDAHPLDALANILDEASMAPRKGEQLE